MAVVTLLTDSGNRDFYAAAVRAKLLSVNPGIRIEEISHHISPGDILFAAFMLNAVFRDFPTGSVHLVAVDATGTAGDGHVAVQLEDHFFVAPNNGILSLISEKAFQQAAILNTIKSISSTFPEKDIMAPAAGKLAAGIALSDLGRPVTDLRRLTGRRLKASRQNILGHVAFVDHFGNLITNISRSIFQELSEGKSYTIHFSGEKFKKLHMDYSQAEPGECFVLFNSLGLLEIGIYRGNASALLGLKADSPVNIIFDE
jgi:S-adenosylmethionine hydrolase